MRGEVFCAGWLLAVTGSPAPAAQADPPAPIHIAAQPLAGALRALGRERRLQIVYRTEVVGDRHSDGIDGILTAEAAIRALLAPTTLTWRYLDERTVMILPQATQPGAAASGPIAPAPPVAGPRAGSGQLREVVVTAQKVQEVASKAPLALNVRTGEILRHLGIDTVQALQSIEPSLHVGLSPSGVNIAIRGVPTTDVSSKGDQGIVFNVDGISLGRPRQMGLALFDIDRVEILRGPQGTLYGKSATGGAINVITNKPRAAFDAAAHVEAGNFNAARGDAMLNLPLNPDLAIRAAASFSRRDGYLEPVLGSNPRGARPRARQDDDQLAGRLSALWNFSDRGSLLLSMNVGRLGGVGSNYTALYDSVLRRSGSAARRIYFNPMGGSIDDRFSNLNAELGFEVGPVRVDYLGARLHYRANDQDRSSGNDPATNGGGNYNWRNYLGEYATDVHELRLSNASPQHVQWVAGINFSDEAIDEHDQSWTTPVARPYLSASTNGIAIIATTTHQTTGLFGQVSLRATDALRLTAGLRRSSDSVRRRGTIAPGPGPWPDAQGRTPCLPYSDCIGVRDDGDQSAAKLTYRVAADLQLARNSLLYASVATGYKAGGFNDYDPAVARTNAYQPEQLTAYEVGLKARPLNRLEFDSAVYYYDYSKHQVTQVVGILNLVPTVAVIYTQTVPAVFQGWENALYFRVSPRDYLNLSAALERSYYRRLRVGFNLASQADWSGYRLDNTPSVATTLAYRHLWYGQDGTSWELHVGSRYNSGYLVSDFGQSRQYRQESFTRSELMLTRTAGDGRFEVQAYVRNIEDGLQLLSPPTNVVAGNAGAGDVAVNEPRTFGVRVGLRY